MLLLVPDIVPFEIFCVALGHWKHLKLQRRWHIHRVHTKSTPLIDSSEAQAPGAPAGARPSGAQLLFASGRLVPRLFQLLLPTSVIATRFWLSAEVSTPPDDPVSYWKSKGKLRATLQIGTSLSAAFLNKRRQEKDEHGRLQSHTRWRGAQLYWYFHEVDYFQRCFDSFSCWYGSSCSCRSRLMSTRSGTDSAPATALTLASIIIPHWISFENHTVRCSPL